MRGWLFLGLVGGCSFDPQTFGRDAAATDDAVFNEVDAPAGELCLGAGAFRVCTAIPTEPFEVMGPANTGIDTDAATNNRCTAFFAQPEGRPTLCVIAATTITIDANILFVSGTHPLVLFASETIHVGRGVDVGSHFNGQAVGAGADADACVAGNSAGSSAGGGGGGAGGSFASFGGVGGGGGNGGAIGATAGPMNGGDFLRGGCAGSGGGNGSGINGGGGNHGGGAVLLLAGTSITITGFVNASGGGGSPGQAGSGGGGGGGSGGMIAMSAPAITVATAGRLLANGGGGGGGADENSAAEPGGDPDETKPTTPAPGGGNGGGGSSGGAAGAAGISFASAANAAFDGAGGGGGGFGVIRILSGQAVGGTNSPTPFQN